MLATDTISNQKNELLPNLTHTYNAESLFLLVLIWKRF